MTDYDGEAPLAVLYGIEVYRRSYLVDLRCIVFTKTQVLRLNKNNWKKDIEQSANKDSGPLGKTLLAIDYWNGLKVMVNGSFIKTDNINEDQESLKNAEIINYNNVKKLSFIQDLGWWSLNINAGLFHFLEIYFPKEILEDVNKLVLTTPVASKLEPIATQP